MKRTFKTAALRIRPGFFAGAIHYHGSKADLIAVGLATAKQFPEEVGDRNIIEYTLHGRPAYCAKHEGGYNVGVENPQPKLCRRILAVTLADDAPPFVRDFPWGCIYYGTKAQLTNAGVVARKDWPTKAHAKRRDSMSSWDGSIARNDEEDRTIPSEVSGDDYPTTIPGDVRVRYEVEDLNIAARLEQAIAAALKVGPLSALQLSILRGIAPRPLSELLRVKARK